MLNARNARLSRSFINNYANLIFQTIGLFYLILCMGDASKSYVESHYVIFNFNLVTMVTICQKLYCL